MKILYSLCFCWLFFSHMSAQVQLERQVISIAGMLSENDQTTLSSTFGETVTETSINGSFLLTQGFQQAGNNTSVSTVSESDLKVDYTIFPNPSSDYLNIKIQAETPIKFLARLTTLDGRLLHEEYIVGDGIITHQWSVDRYTPGMYLLSIYDKKGRVKASEKVQIMR